MAEGGANDGADAAGADQSSEGNEDGDNGAAALRQSVLASNRKVHRLQQRVMRLKQRGSTGHAHSADHDDDEHDHDHARAPLLAELGKLMVALQRAPTLLVHIGGLLPEKAVVSFAQMLTHTAFARAGHPLRTAKYVSWSPNILTFLSTSSM